MITVEQDPEMDARVEEAESLDSQMFVEASPRGRFSPQAMNALVKSANSLLPAFGQKDLYPSFGATPSTLEAWPEDLTRIISMFQSATKDAVVEEVITPELVIDISTTRDDNGVQLLAGKINSLSKSRDFKRWLQEEVQEPKAPEQPEQKPEEVDIDALFASRLK